MGESDVSLTVGFRDALVVGDRGTTWNFDPRGNAYASAFTSYRLYYSLTCQDRIGNAINVMAIQRAPNRQGVSQSMCNKLARVSDSRSQSHIGLGFPSQRRCHWLGHVIHTNADLP